MMDAYKDLNEKYQTTSSEGFGLALLLRTWPFHDAGVRKVHIEERFRAASYFVNYMQNVM